MIRPIIKSQLIFARPSVPATAEDAAVARDLLDTLAAHEHECVGLAANMIGSPKRVIAFRDGARNRAMFNPCIVSHTGPYKTEEACLSLAGTRPTTRYRRITVAYQEVEDGALVDRHAAFTGFTAQIVQHEIDHCEGTVI